MGATPNPPPPSLDQAPHNTWWSVWGTYPDGSEFAGAIAYVTRDDEDQPVVDVLLGGDFAHHGTRIDLEQVTQGNPLVLVDGEVPGRLQSTVMNLVTTQFQLQAAQAVIDATREICARTEDIQFGPREKVEQITAMLPPAE